MTYKYKQIIFSILIIGCFLNACSENKSLTARYQAEKMFHDAENALDEAQAFNTNLSAEQLNQITDNFKTLVEFCYTQISSTDSTLHPVEYNEFNYLTYRAATRLSQLYYLNKNFDQCVLITKRLLTDINIPATQKAAVYINLGQALQSAGNWDSAYTVYENALEVYSPPLTDTHEIISSIFNLPLYLFRVVKYISGPEAITREAEKTENYYKKLIQNFTGQKLETASRANLAKLYEETGQWNKELSQLELLTDEQSKSYYTVLLKTADLLGGKLSQQDSALAIYNYIYDKTTEENEEMRSLLMFKKSLIQIDLGNYESARTLLYEIKNNYPLIYDQSPLFQYNLGRSFELQNKWNRAEQEYNLLLEKFKGSSESMMTLLYLVDHFRNQGNTLEKNRWYNRAETYFQDLSKSGRGSLLEARAMLYQADLYNRNDEVEKSALLLHDIFNKFPESDPGKQALLRSINLYKFKLDNTQKADSLLEELKLTLAKTPVTSNSEDLFED